MLIIVYYFGIILYFSNIYEIHKYYYFVIRKVTITIRHLLLGTKSIIKNPSTNFANIKRSEYYLDTDR